MTEMNLIVSFPDQSENFTLGFEAGSLAYAMETVREPEIDRGFETGLPIHSENIEVVKRMAAAWSYSVEFGPRQDDWIGVRLRLQTSPKPTLRLIGETGHG